MLIMFGGYIPKNNVRYHFIQDVIVCVEITMRKINTHDNPADMLTKSLPI